MRQRKHHMKVLDGQQFLCAQLNPFIASVDLALRTMPVTTRVERDGSMTTLRTAIHMAAQGRSTAVLDGTQHPKMLPSQPATILLNELLTNGTENVSHLDRWPVHLFCRFLERLTSSDWERLSASSGLATACKCRRDK